LSDLLHGEVGIRRTLGSPARRREEQARDRENRSLPISYGEQRSPHLRASRRVGRSAFGAGRTTLFDNRWMRVCAAGSAIDRRWPAGGWRSHTRPRLPGGGVIRSPCHRRSDTRCSLGIVAQRKRTRLSIGGVRVRIPSVPLAITLGFCSSLVERLVEAQRAAGSIPAEAILGKHAAVAERQTRDAQNVVGWARESSSLSGGMRCRVAQRESGGLISRDGRGFESHPCNPAPVAQLAERPPRKREVVGSEPTRSPGSGGVADW
jgi:hypothetical protein